MPTNWSRRFKNHVEKLKSGDIYQVAEVVRNLSLREKDKGLSAGEKRMLAKARQILVSELTFAINVTEEEAEAKLDEALGLSATTSAAISRCADGVWAIVVAAGSGSRFGGAQAVRAAAGRARPRLVAGEPARARRGRRRGAGGRRPIDGRRPEPLADRRGRRRRPRARTRCGRGSPPCPPTPTWSWCTTPPDRSPRPTLFAAVVEAVRDGADAAIPGVAGDRHHQAGGRRSGGRDARSGRRWWPCRRPRPSGPTRCARAHAGRSARPPTTPRWSRPPAAGWWWCRATPATSRSPRVRRPASAARRHL